MTQSKGAPEVDLTRLRPTSWTHLPAIVLAGTRELADNQMPRSHRGQEEGALMGQVARVLMPGASPLHYFGAEVRRLRGDRDWSQAELGSAVIASKDLVRRIETAERFPTAEFVARCDTALDCDGYLRRMWPILERERQLQLARADSGYLAARCDRAVLDWIISGSNVASGAGRQLSGKDSPVLGEELGRLRQLDHLHGAGRYYALVAQSLPAVEVAAPHIAIGYLELAGYEAVDLGADGAAQGHYLRALDVATRVGDRLYGGYLVAVSLAHLALHCGDPVQAIRLSSAALHGTAGVGTPATQASFHSVLARAHARLGDAHAATTALGQAERALSRSRRGEEPPYIRYFGEADLADERAHVFYDLGLHSVAQNEARVAISAVSPSRVRRLAIDTALLASSLAQSRSVDEACQVGRQAIDFAAATSSFRSAHRIMMMLAQLQPYNRVPAVRDLFEYANFRLPESVAEMQPNS